MHDRSADSKAGHASPPIRSKPRVSAGRPSQGRGAGPPLSAGLIPDWTGASEVGRGPDIPPHPAPPDGGGSAFPARGEAEGEAAPANPSPGGRGAGVRGYGLSGEATTAHA